MSCDRTACHNHIRLLLRLSILWLYPDTFSDAKVHTAVEYRASTVDHTSGVMAAQVSEGNRRNKGSTYFDPRARYVRKKGPLSKGVERMRADGQLM